MSNNIFLEYRSWFYPGCLFSSKTTMLQHEGFYCVPHSNNQILPWVVINDGFISTEHITHHINHMWYYASFSTETDSLSYVLIVVGHDGCLDNCTAPNLDLAKNMQKNWALVSLGVMSSKANMDV